MVEPCDGKGEVLFYDDFEDYAPRSLAFDAFGQLAKWSYTSEGVVGAGWDAGLSVLWAKSGSRSVELITANNITSDIVLARTFSRPTSRRIGFEFSFMLATNIDYIQVEPLIYRANAIYHADILFSVTQAQIRYRDANNNFVSLMGIGNVPANTENTLKFVLDQDLNQFSRLWYNGQERAMTGLAYRTEAVSAYQGSWIYFRIHARASTAANNRAWVDDFILTHKEP